MRIEFTEGITSSGLDRKLIVLSLFTNNSLRLFPEKCHEEPSIKSLCLDILLIDGEYRKICPWQVIDEKLRCHHHKQF